MSANENQLQIEVLQPEISGKIQQVTPEELKNWIKDGKLKPFHQVKIKNLAWIEAQKIPAFKELFDLKNTELEAQKDNYNNRQLSENFALKLDKLKTNKAAYSPKETLIAGSKISTGSETKDTAIKSEPKTAEPSIPLKIYEKKALAKNKQSEPKNKPFQISPNGQRKSFPVKKTVGFLAGCVVIFLLASGCSYLWVYQLKVPVEIDENNSPELSKLKYKLTSDKLELRVKKAALENELKNSGNQEQTAQQTDVSQEIAKLEKQYDTQRENILENHSVQLQNDDFYTTFYSSFAILLCLFFLMRIFYGQTPETAANRVSPELPDIKHQNALNIPLTVFQKVNPENSPATDTAKLSVANSAEIADIPDVLEETSYTIEGSDEAEILESPDCFMHKKRTSKFVCQNCSLYFCSECSKTLNEVENCCPLCKRVCNSVDAKIQEENLPTEVPEKKKKNLLDLGKNTDFIVYDFADERTGKLGVIPAILISLMFSIAISIAWVFVVPSYLEKSEKEVVQNASTDKQQESGKTIGAKTSEQSAAKNPDTNTSANEACIDPQTGQPFECDEVTRAALYDHTMKVKSAEKAQKETSEKTNLILGSVVSTSNSASENVKQEDAKPNFAEEGRKALEKQKLFKVFICSFLILFGLLMSTRLFSKD
ncbi:MAG: hypothetical protein ABIP06_08730 [Pyrinomonadaceae bacterium]